MRRIRAVSQVLAVVMLAGCGSDKVASPEDQSPTTVSGVFALQSVNQKPLPYSVVFADVDGDLTLTITSYKITLQPGGKYAEEIVATARQGGQTTPPTTIPGTGTFVYTSSTHAISLLSSSGDRITGTVLNETMTLTDDTDTLVFRRQ